MRTILFRGKRIDNGEWVIGYYVQKQDPLLVGIVYHFIIVQEKDDHDMLNSTVTWYKVDAETVGQYTGSLDCEGEKIFEGDIITYADYDEYLHYLEALEHPEEYKGTDFSRIWTMNKVVYGDEIGYPAFDLNSHDFDSNGLSYLKESCQFYYKIIGNIHDNPELLKGVAKKWQDMLT